ncbi:uncharacterized protein BJ212DRAFT_619312 [Suillus subaureus]|uniref:DUF6533 domain-containing protein n=1 Tax=Suillus subaureus TaxID=48587 RepID=A0A9P7E1R8_9AGAM|nr:uncharacterized protein BJ212DRAFT_619312 [Suillus subaureus]KAG1809151.1 hypothetical protein BJ212DRAFT_619312 [Suillus subaureus]
MEYSASDIAAARILQYLAYICTALITFWTYDYLCSLHDEWTFLLRSRWTKVKCLYITARYIPFFLITSDIFLTLTPVENSKACKMLISIYSCFAVISLTCSECISPSSRHRRAPDPIHPGFFVLRTYALWSNNRIILVAMLSTLFAVIVSFIGIWFSAVAKSQYFSTGAIPGITGCYRTSNSVQLYLPFIVLFVFQLGLVTLTLIRAIRDWRSTRYPLYATLVKHNIFYYACGLLFSALNVLVPVIFPDVRKPADTLQYDGIIDVSHSQSSYHSFLEDLEVFILAILATRMHLRLWHIDNIVRDLDTLSYISMSVMSPTV